MSEQRSADSARLSEGERSRRIAAREAREQERERLVDVLGDLVHDYIARALVPWQAYMAIEDVYAIAEGVLDEINDAGIEVANREKIAAHLMTHIGGDGDTNPPWQAGHDYAMTEAARLVRERWDLLSRPGTTAGGEG